MFAVKTCSRFAALTAFVCALALAGCGKKDEPTKAEADPKPAEPKPADPKGGPTPPNPTLPTPPTPAPPESLAKAKADVVITAEEWAKQSEGAGGSFKPFDKNAGKIVELSGVVKHAGDQLQLDAGSERLPLILPTTDKEPWKKALPGQTAVLRARIVGLVKWEIIEVKGPAPDKFTAEELVRAVSSDLKGMEKKYKDKYIIVSGVIEKVEALQYGHVNVKLKSQNGTLIECFFSGSLDREKARNKSFQTGMKLVALGGYDGTSLRPCEVMELAP